MNAPPAGESTLATFWQRFERLPDWRRQMVIRQALSIVRRGILIGTCRIRVTDGQALTLAMAVVDKSMAEARADWSAVLRILKDAR